MRVDRASRTRVVSVRASRESKDWSGNPDREFTEFKVADFPDTSGVTPPRCCSGTPSRAQRGFLTRGEENHAHSLRRRWHNSCAKIAAPNSATGELTHPAERRFRRMTGTKYSSRHNPRRRHTLRNARARSGAGARHREAILTRGHHAFVVGATRQAVADAFESCVGEVASRNAGATGSYGTNSANPRVPFSVDAGDGPPETKITSRAWVFLAQRAPSYACCTRTRHCCIHARTSSCSSAGAL